jgi:hypothetical protein
MVQEKRYFIPDLLIGIIVQRLIEIHHALAG